MNLIFGILGVRGSGKDTLAHELSKDMEGVWTPVLLSFSEAIRLKTFDLLGLKPLEGKEYTEFKTRHYNSFKGVNKTGREWLEYVGEGMRKQNPSIWADEVMKQVLKEKYHEGKNYGLIFYDVRFPHEMAVVNMAAKLSNTKPSYIFCDYRSERYDDENCESNKLALELRDEGYKHRAVIKTFGNPDEIELKDF
jgi:hypothetical protein